MPLEEMIDELKEKVLALGGDAVADVLGYEPDDDDEDYMKDALDETLDQMPEEEIRELYDKYC